MVKILDTVGRTTYVDFPNLTSHVPAKVDTGAFRSSIHCESIKVIKKGNTKFLRVELLGHPCSPDKFLYEFKRFKKVTVTNSFGHSENRYEVTLRLKLKKRVANTSFTLSDRSGTLFPVLIGRKFLKNRFVVDVSRASIRRLKLKQEFNIDLPIDEEDLE